MTSNKGAEMIDTSVEEPIPLSVAARETTNRRGSRGIATPTAWRWAMKGVKGIRLETIMVGGIRMTTRPALARFFAAVTAAADGTAIPSRTSAQRERAIARDAAELEAAGI